MAWTKAMLKSDNVVVGESADSVGEMATWPLYRKESFEIHLKNMMY
jgi:hypothetical protein